MVYDIRLNPVKEILVRYIYQAADISMISSQSGLDQGSIPAGGAAVNYWQVVLERACLEGLSKLDAVLDRAVQHLKGTVAEAPCCEPPSRGTERLAVERTWLGRLVCAVKVSSSTLPVRASLRGNRCPS